jgi:hypothetical protein
MSILKIFGIYLSSSRKNRTRKMECSFKKIRSGHNQTWDAYGTSNTKCAGPSHVPSGVTGIERRGVLLSSTLGGVDEVPHTLLGWPTNSMSTMCVFFLIFRVFLLPCSDGGCSSSWSAPPPPLPTEPYAVAICGRRRKRHLAAPPSNCHL